MNYLLPFWNYRISAGLTLLTGLLLLAISRRQGYPRAHYPMGLGTVSQCVRGLHEHCHRS
jgi:hypothetical protein